MFPGFGRPGMFIPGIPGLIIIIGCIGPPGPGPIIGPGPIGPPIGPPGPICGRIIGPPGGPIIGPPGGPIIGPIGPIGPLGLGGTRRIIISQLVLK